ncbi:hypothetical protein Asi03nite_17480 [Actinoplanes siamensis]|uniref:Peptidase inhibitor family I36 n=1 Tax=Actinoplanes siamensis TaxID=1223317 RepID=A0A919TJ64_9ACTN|nr:hypothetical protein Asi03nite_17480 [Actinoplanes siamensis]
MFAVLTLTATLMFGTPASAADTAGVKVDTAKSRPAKVASARFAAEGRAAGLDAGQARALQGEVNLYLAKYGKAARQVSFNTIALKGADIHVAVPGEAHPRGIAGTYCAYKWFCAYEYEYQNGSDIHMYDCGVTWYIPWFTTGSWVNNQTPGTRPLLTFTDGSTWRMPGAYAQQLSGVGWSPVSSIVPC